jgi:hypothetical protein
MPLALHHASTFAAPVPSPLLLQQNMGTTPLSNFDALLQESCEEVLDMACGDADPDFFDSQEDDWQGCHESSCEEYSKEDRDDDYGNEEQEPPSVE